MMENFIVRISKIAEEKTVLGLGTALFLVGGELNTRGTDCICFGKMCSWEERRPDDSRD